MLDLLVRGGTILDGSGGPRFTGDVGVRDGRIAAVGRVGEPARRTLEAGGLVVTPGWVDIHTHYRPVLNYSHGNLDAIREMLQDEHTVPGLGDAGAHVGLICDGSFPTFLVSHWGKDRVRGEKLPVETLVRSQTSDTAALVGLGDRGRLAPGLRADLNLIEWDALGVRHPEIVFDLPAGGKRLVQRATGYRATVVAGEVTFEAGESTGALPGRLVRGARGA